MHSQSLFCGIIFCTSVAALIIASLAFNKKGNGENYKEVSSSNPATCSPSSCNLPDCNMPGNKPWCCCNDRAQGGVCNNSIGYSYQTRNSCIEDHGYPGGCVWCTPKPLSKEITPQCLKDIIKNTAGGANAQSTRDWKTFVKDIDQIVVNQESCH